MKDKQVDGSSQQGFTHGISPRTAEKVQGNHLKGGCEEDRAGIFFCAVQWEDKRQQPQIGIVLEISFLQWGWLTVKREAVESPSLETGPDHLQRSLPVSANLNQSVILCCSKFYKVVIYNKLMGSIQKCREAEINFPMQQLKVFVTWVGGLISFNIILEITLNTEAEKMYYKLSARKGKMRLLYNSYFFHIKIKEKTQRKTLPIFYHSTFFSLYTVVFWWIGKL